jgi:hypothetical protein
MIVNFRARGISRGKRKLVRTSILKKKKKEEEIHRSKSLKTHIYADQILDPYVFADFSTFLLRSIFTLGIIMNIH